MKKYLLTILLCLPFAANASECPSEATLTITSSGYSGEINVELRKGTRPGSKVTASKTMYSQGRHTFYEVCPGRYFYAFGTPDSEQVSVTQYFDVTFDGSSYSNPEIEVFYTRSSNGKRVGTAKKSAL